ncbi:MAG: efflux RND transporter periplasmic adaptor subunit [Thermovirgaceae bacterium]|nr:efflux RND transporter periplasmic adaptor subunit [Thermovirgaceae bacterium]
MKKTAALLLVVGVFVGLIAFRGFQQRSEDQTVPDAGAVSVAVAALTERVISEAVGFSATIEPEEQAAVVAKVPGKTVLRVFVSEGDLVKKGQALAALDRSIVEQQLAEAGAVFEAAAADNERYQSLFAEEVISRQAADHAKTRYLQAKSALEQIRLLGGYHTITAPVDGVIARRFIDPGDTSSQQGPAFLIFRQEKVKAVGSVPERIYAGINTGDSVSLTVDAVPGEVFEARVSRISPVIDPATRTGRIEIAVPSGGVIRPGMFARVTLRTGERDAMVLPAEAISRLPGTGESICFIARDGIAVLRVVKTGIEQGGWVEITGGVSPEEEVITTRSGKIQDGTGIEVYRQ